MNDTTGHEGFSAVRLSPQAEGGPRARYDSGLTIHEEALAGGRWIGRYWSDAGFAETEARLAWLVPNAHSPQETAGLDLGAFGLEMDGCSLHYGWEPAGMEEGAGSRPHMRRALVRLRSTLRPVSLAVSTETDGTGFLMRRLSVTNTGDRPAAMGALWVWAGLLSRVGEWRRLMGADGPVFRLGYMTERAWAREGTFDWLPLPSTPVRIESRVGRSGHSTPFFLVENRATGQIAAGGLAWSANWAAEFTAEQGAGGIGSGGEALLSFRIGPTAPSPQRILAPGETVESPWAHLGFFSCGLDGAVQAWHAHLRRSVLSPEVPGREGLVAYNHWGYTGHEMDGEKLRREVDVAAEAGAEVFIVDAGWYGDKGSDWWKTAGDWGFGSRLPDGLGPVFDHARGKGLLCGLWVDLERMGSESRAAREHPDWLQKCHGKPTPNGDMDLGNPAAVEHLERTLCGLIEGLGLDLFRLDYNTRPWEGGQAQREGGRENVHFRYYENVYALYGRIRARYPRLIMENCAGGGGRADLGMVALFSHTWVTDWPRMPRWARILNGMSMALPPERIDRCAGVGQAAHEAGGLETHLRASMFSRLTLSGLYPQAGLANGDMMEAVKRFVRLYKEFVRPLLPACRVFHHTPVLRGSEPEGWAVLEYAAEDRSRAMAGLFRLAGPAAVRRRFRPRGLDAARRYRVRFDSTGDAAVMDGAALRAEGLSIRLPHPLSSELILFEEAP